MGDFIKTACSECGAKYRLPIEFQGRTARCKKCGAKFSIPANKNIEDSVLDWLTEGDVDDAADEPAEAPRVVSMGDSGGKASVRKGLIRLKHPTEGADESTAGT